jgi:hypothetical protein
LLTDDEHFSVGFAEHLLQPHPHLLLQAQRRKGLRKVKLAVSNLEIISEMATDVLKHLVDGVSEVEGAGLCTTAESELDLDGSDDLVGSKLLPVLSVLLLQSLKRLFSLLVCS